MGRWIHAESCLVGGKLVGRGSELEAVAPHDLRRTCASLCQQAGDELEQIQFLLGNQPVQTTERYRGCKQHLHNAVNDRISIGLFGSSADESLTG